MFDSNSAVTRCGRMWRKLGSLIEVTAYDKAQRGFEKQAVELARLAEVCFWQATGEMDAAIMADVLPTKAEA